MQLLMLNQLELSAISYLKPKLRKHINIESHAIYLVGSGKMVESKIVT